MIGVRGYRWWKRHIFLGKCGLFNSCRIPDGNPTERKLAFRQGFLWRCLCVQNER